MYNDELSQWCKIDGHEWISYHVSYGMALGPKTVNMSRKCVKCLDVEFKVLVPYGEQTGMNTLMLYVNK